MKCKRIIILTILVLTILSLFVSAVYADVWVNGYTRKNGTHVQGYWRSSPDSDPTNNFSYPGNVNPYTGKVAPGNPETYLKDYPNYSNKPNVVSVPSPQIPTNISPLITIQKESVYTFKLNKIRKIGFSSVDDVFTAVAINSIRKNLNAPPFTIGSSEEDVIRAMGTPESIEVSFKSFKYRNSTIYFDDDWKVQSWDNRYGNLKVSLENECRIDVLDIDDIFKIINDNLTEEFTILSIDKSIEETIEEFQKYLENQ